MRVFKRLVLVVIFLAVIFGGIFGWKYHQIQQMMAQQSQPQPPAVVTATQVKATQWQPTIPSTGSLKAVNGVSVTTEVAGVVSKIAFNSSERVKEGDVLVQLDDSVDQAALKGLMADRELAKTQFQRSSNLLPRKAVSRSQYDEAKAKYDSAQANVAEQQARINKKTIRAPFDGLLGLRQVDMGEYLTPGNPIVTLQQLDPIYLDFSVPAKRFNDITVGQAIQASVDAYPDRTFSGKVTAIDSGVDEGTRSVKIRATLPNPDGELRPGMFAETEALKPSKEDVLVIPRTAISYNTYGDYVFVIKDKDGSLTVDRQQVETGQTQEGMVNVTKGLSEGDRVVAAGLVKLHNGQSVKIDNSVKLDHGEVSGE
ncbi:MAG TPA: efflux RND transporter periplasmic adaptor subunit [Gammaproteobacteria bacterium]|nr:efflux RND transporter periplasmic adaptor subunit [Gammaproteobacteria bacterium]